VVREGHPLSHDRLTLDGFAAARHISTSRRGRFTGPIDKGLADRGLRRQTVCTVPSWIVSLHMVAQTDLVGIAPEQLSRDAVRLLNLRTLAIPLPLPPIVISQAWHARHDADATHAWFRRCVRELVASLAMRTTNPVLPP
jgi:DNA-binding transcriptional LysR family regulator